MKNCKHIFAVDSHTMGEPTRVVIGGLPPVPGNTMADKKSYLISKMDYIRTALMHEPRGHRDMFGSIILAPTNPEADLGLVFMDGGGYLNMCGHGTIGSVTVALEMGIVEKVEPFTKITIDTPAGLLTASAEIKDGVISSVAVTNVPAFLYREDVMVELEAIGSVPISIAFGGNFFALVDSKRLGLDIEPGNINKLVKIGMSILAQVNKHVAIAHPTNNHIKTVDLVEIYGPSPQAGIDARNIVIFGSEQFDRSPCGTGTCAKMSLLYAKGQLKLNQCYKNESIIGTVFQGRVVAETSVGTLPAIIPEISGQAFITGINQFVIDSADPVKNGFLVGI